MKNSLQIEPQAYQELVDFYGQLFDMPPLSAKILTPESFNNTINIAGSIEASEEIDLRSEISGIVRSILFKEGSFVTKGQVLFKIDDLELRAQFAQAKTKQNLASENARRAKLLLEKDAISQEEFDIATADFRSAQAQTQLIQAQLAKTVVKAPFSGKIGLRYISPGTYVTPTKQIS